MAELVSEAWTHGSRTVVGERAAMSAPCAVFAANRGYALTSSRTSLIRHFLDCGWEVVLATADDAESRSLGELGARLEPVAFHRGGFSFLSDARAFHRMRSIYQRWRPVLIQHFHAKPAIFGTLAARRALGQSVRVVNAITGLGNAFVSGGITPRLAGVGYSLAGRHADRTVFQNRDDMELFLKKGWADSSRACLIPSSGVDLNYFGMVNRRGPVGQAPVAAMLGRLLRPKGILEFVAVAARIRRHWPDARFLLAGEEEPDRPDGITSNWLEMQEGVEYLGRLSDVRPLLAEADVFLFPSFYREGVPRAILEAAATGLPVVAFDVPGVREAVIEGESGYLVPDRDIDSLTARVETLLKDEELRLRMGRAGRLMVERDFDVQAVERQYLDLYREQGITV
jgi:glycosyltransferase involved in cell wall biosynthesis